MLFTTNLNILTSDYVKLQGHILFEKLTHCLGTLLIDDVYQKTQKLFSTCLDSYYYNLHE